MESKEEVAKLTGHDGYVLSIALNKTNTILASGSTDTSIKLWNIEKKEEIETLEGHEMQVNSVTFHSNGTILASGSEDQMIKLWNVETKEEIATLKAAAVISSILFTSNIIISGD